MVTTTTRIYWDTSDNNNPGWAWETAIHDTYGWLHSYSGALLSPEGDELPANPTAAQLQEAIRCYCETQGKILIKGVLSEDNPRHSTPLFGDASMLAYC